MLLLSRLPFLVPVTVAAALTLSAQQPSQAPATALCRPSALLNPFLAPVAGAPVTATYLIKIEWPHVLGSTETLGSTFQVARDSRGRISHELRELVPAFSAGAPPLYGVVLYDPRTQMSQTIDPANRTDVELQLHLPPRALSASSIAEVEDLGRKTISGLDVEGVRRSLRSRAKLSLATQPWQTSDESWYSNDLHMIVSERRTNPLGGMMVITMAEIDRHEPPDALFQVPQGYRVIRPKTQLFTSFVGGGQPWAIPGPDYDPNDIDGAYPALGFGGFSFSSGPR